MENPDLVLLSSIRAWFRQHEEHVDYLGAAEVYDTDPILTSMMMKSALDILISLNEMADRNVHYFWVNLLTMKTLRFIQVLEQRFRLQIAREICQNSINIERNIERERNT